MAEATDIKYVHKRLERIAPSDSGKADAATVRAQNERLLLNHIWCRKEVSRADISRITGLSRSTVSAIVQSLVDTGLVRFLRAGTSSGGRRPILLGFADDATPLVGIDLGATHIGVAITDLRCRVQAWRSERYDVRNDAAGTLDRCVRLVREAFAQTPWSIEQAVGVGVAVAAPIHPDRPEMLSSLVLPAWEGVDLPRHLGSAFGRPVFIDNDANLGALAEVWWGAGINGKDLAFVKLGTGIGAGLVHNGMIYRGATGIAGEIGHIVVEPNGRECLCGLRGCLGTVASSSALKERVAEALAEGTESCLDENVDTEALVAAVERGDPLAVRLVENAGRRLGTAIASLVNLINPATVVVGGGMARAGETLFEPLREAMRSRALLQSFDEVRVIASTLEDREIALGAATIVLEAALNDPRLFPAIDGAKARVEAMRA